jgi:hypothetical protein
MCLSMLSAAEVVNLNFDSPNLSGSLTPVYPGQSIAPYFGQASELLRGWRLTLDGNVVDRAIYSPWGSLPASPDATVVLQQWNPSGGPSPFGVNYLLIDSSTGPTFHEFRLSQLGAIPVDANGLSVYSTLRWSLLINDAPVGAWFQNQVLPVNVSQFAGQTVKMEFVFQGGGDGFFDIVGFTQIPEPSTCLLFCVGMVLLVANFIYGGYRR